MSTKMWNWGDLDNEHDPIVECIGEIHQPAITIDNRSGDDLTIPFDQLDPLIDHLKSCKQFLYERGLDEPAHKGELK